MGWLSIYLVCWWHHWAWAENEKHKVIKSPARFVLTPPGPRGDRVTTAKSKEKPFWKVKGGRPSTHVGVLFDRHVKLLLQLNHGAHGFGELLQVPPVEHASVDRVVVHVLAYSADFCGGDTDAYMSESRARLDRKQSKGSRKGAAGDHVSSHLCF